MTGQDFQLKLDAIVRDLQTVGKGRTVTITLRAPDNSVTNLPLSSTAEGMVSRGELTAIKNFIAPLKESADSFFSASAPVAAASEAFRTAGVPFTALADAATLARKSLSDAQFADPVYQAAKSALENARLEPNYLDAKYAYESQNTVENFGNLGDAKGKYQPISGGGGGDSKAFA